MDVCTYARATSNPSQSCQASYKRHTRRSHPDLQQLSIKPLTPSFPLPQSEDDPARGRGGGSHDGRHLTATPQSYIAPRSLPQTPSILSRSNSRARSRKASRSSAALNHFSHTTSASDALVGTTPTPRRLKGSHRRSHSTKSPGHSDSTGWLLQTASALTVSAAESKGQAWLATRTSSTSLADGAAHGSRDALYTADDEFSPVSYRHTSRPSSRFGSRGTSRRGSRVGIMTPLGIKTPGDRDGPGADYFESVRADFVEDEEDEEDPEAEDSEVKQVIWGHVGGWVDWAVGWMDFRADEDEKELDQLEHLQEGVAASSPRADSKRTIKFTKKRPGKEGATDVYSQTTRHIPRAPEHEGVVQDAAWLLGLARNNLA